MHISRRTLLSAGAGAITFLGFGRMPAFASEAEDAIAALLDGAPIATDQLTIEAPEIAENGNNVPITVTAEGAQSITLFADGNPEPKIASFAFGPLSQSGFASTRVRLAQTQNVIAIAKMSDGSFQRAQAVVKVTIGGCGG